MRTIDMETRDRALAEADRDRAELAQIALDMERNLEEMAAAINKIDHTRMRMARHLVAIGRLEESNERTRQRLGYLEPA